MKCFPIIILGLLILISADIKSYAQTKPEYSSFGWEVDYYKDDFGEPNGNCQLSITLFKVGSTYKLVFLKSNAQIVGIFIHSNFKDDIKSQAANLSFKADNNKVIQIHGSYNKNDKYAIFDRTNDRTNTTNEIISLFKKSSKLKIAFKLSDHDSTVLEIDCDGFTEAYNEMWKCKK